MGSKAFGLVTILALLACSQEDADITFNDLVQNVSIHPKEVPADGESKIFITVEFPNGINFEKSTVTFQTDNGVFQGESKNSVLVKPTMTMINGEQKAIAVANLISSRAEGKALLKTQILSFSRIDTIFYQRAFPDSIKTSTNVVNYVASESQEVMLTTEVFRKIGKPSIGTIVEIKAIGQNNEEIGVFRNKAMITDSSNKILNFFSISPSVKYNGPVKIIARTLRDDGIEMSDELIINVKTN